jgi:hypothetical protein
LGPLDAAVFRLAAPGQSSGRGTLNAATRGPIPEPGYLAPARRPHPYAPLTPTPGGPVPPAPPLPGLAAFSARASACFASPAPRSLGSGGSGSAAPGLAASGARAPCVFLRRASPVPCSWVFVRRGDALAEAGPGQAQRAPALGRSRLRSARRPPLRGRLPSSASWVTLILAGVDISRGRCVLPGVWAGFGARSAGNVGGRGQCDGSVGPGKPRRGRVRVLSRCLGGRLGGHRHRHAAADAMDPNTVRGASRLDLDSPADLRLRHRGVPPLLLGRGAAPGVRPAPAEAAARPSPAGVAKPARNM